MVIPLLRQEANPTPSFMVQHTPICGRHYSAIWLLVMAVSTAAPVVSQSSGQLTHDTIEQKWADLPALLMPPKPGEDAAERFLLAADTAQVLAATDPSDDRAAEARRLEGKGLLQAALVGAPLSEGRLQTLLTTVRKDDRLSVRARWELVKLSEIVRLRPLLRDPDKFLPAYEASLLAQIAEFPSEAGAYESLLRFAESHPREVETARIAQDVARMPAAPAEALATAATMIARQALVGQSLVEMLRPALPTESPLLQPDGHGIILYTWSAQSPGSLTNAKNLLKNHPEKVRLLGVNLDTDEAAAKAAAQAAELTGEQIYDTRGPAGMLAQALKLTRAGEVYVADPQGVLRTVSAQRGDLSTKFGYATAPAR